jgi:uncharacterized membrane protein YhaH (DUF805 family)
MHDINRSGWWIIAPIVNIIFSLQKGDGNKNEYGEPTNYQN